MIGLIHPSSLNASDEAWILSIQAPDFRLELPLNEGQLWVYKPAEDIQAFVYFRRIGSTLEILSLATHPNFRRRGLMRKLLIEFIENFCKSTQVAEIWLEVHEKNQAALQTYLSQGFQITGSRPNYYRDAGGALLMTYTLAK